MEFVADLHIHSKYSRAVSQNMTLPVMAQYAKLKGIDILATADWTHPLWFREILDQLQETQEGLFQLKSQISNFKSQINTNSDDEGQNSKIQKPTLFILTTEISSIYSQGGKTRRIHNLVFSPSFVTCEKISKELVKRGCNLMADGRPIIGLSSKQLIEMVLSIDENAMLVPCHAWTPWFSLYGSNSGFDSIEECFGEYSKYIYAVETGLSSDPEMNWRIPELKHRSIISSSDSHSPMKMGREATVFVPKDKNEISNSKFLISNEQINYQDIVGAIRQDGNSKLKIRYTIEFYPEEGKYHYTGHRNCKVTQSPEETKAKGVICPVCARQLTVGVMHRVEQLAQHLSSVQIKEGKNGVKWYGDPSGKHPPYVKLVPLLEIIAESLESTVASVKVKDAYEAFCNRFGSELNILLKTSIDDIAKVSPRIAEGILKVRKGDIVLIPGFDGEYGKVKIWPNVEHAKQSEEQNEEVLSLKDEPQLTLEF